MNGIHNDDSNPLGPPDGLTIRETARWWAGEPIKLTDAFKRNAITEDVVAAIIQVTKDNDLAHKIIDAKMVKGLYNEERSRLYYLLTDGGEWEGKSRTRPPETVRDLILAFKIQDIDSARERNKVLRSVTGKYSKDVNNIGHLHKHLVDLLARFADADKDDLRKILKHATDENIKLSEDEIHLQLELVEQFRQEEINIT